MSSLAAAAASVSSWARRVLRVQTTKPRARVAPVVPMDGPRPRRMLVGVRVRAVVARGEAPAGLLATTPARGVRLLWGPSGLAPGLVLVAPVSGEPALGE